MSLSVISLLSLAFIWGIRHGIDWDHIAAILDLTGGEKNKKKGFMLGMWYAFGHEMIIILLGGAAVFFGHYLPGWLDHFMEKFVGITLVVLSIIFLNVLFHNNKEAMLVSRWRLLYTGVVNVINWMIWKFIGRKNSIDAKLNLNMSRKGAFLVGIIHGIGAETPSQLLLFMAASGANSPVSGVMTVVMFVAGLLVSHSVLALISLFGLSQAMKKPAIYRGFGIAAAAYSMFVGALFLFDAVSILPPI